jgi:hypothetical protein
MTETTPPINPYVGPRTFQEVEADRFFGREREARELVALVMSERLTLFYAQSGAGKSSLLNARVIPRLRDQEGFTVLPVGRVSGVLADEVDPRAIDNIFVYHLIQGLSQKLAEQEVWPPAGREQKAADLAHTSLARFLSGEIGPDTAADAELSGADSAEGLVPYVLIIDQFEELLTTYPERWQERTGFFEQISTAMARHPNLWVLLTLREDYVANLDPYSHLVPNRLRARFYMQHMGIEAAREAVERPAAYAKRPFAAGVAGMLVDNLRMVRTAGQTEYHAGEYVEPVQLQVVCFQLWGDLRSREATTIELADLERLARGGNLAKYVDRALSDFYERAIARVLEKPDLGITKLALRSWFSDKLITKAGTRSIVFRNETTGETDGLPNRAVDLLAAQFLLRTELRAGGAWVELVHDRFIDPILQSNQAWFNLNPIAIAAQAWKESGKDPTKLYEGRQLADAIAQIEAEPADFGDLEHEYVGASWEAKRRLEARQKVLVILALTLTSVLIAAISAWAISGRDLAQWVVLGEISARSNSEAARMTAVAGTSNTATAFAKAQTPSATVMSTGGVTLVPTRTPVPPVTPNGTPTLVCVNAIVNGDFANDLATWQQVGDPAGVAQVTNPEFSSPYAIQLGSLAQNLNGLSSIRQMVTVPLGFSQATLGLRVYTRSQPGAGADYQQVALLNSSGTPMFVPWQTQSNNPAWTQLLFDVSAFTGQSVFVSFSVNNDGTGGRTAMVVSDARLLSCNATPGPRATPTRTATPGSATAVLPIIALTPFPPGCIDLLRNGGFEGGWPPWSVPNNPIMPQIVVSPVFNGYYALQLGSQTQNASSYSAVRQWITIPQLHPRVFLQFWANTWAQSLTGEDRQEVALLAPGDTVISVPWKVLENSQTWQPHSFDLVGLAGQTFAVYFNVFNDGTDGRTAMWVDDAHLWACSDGTYPPPMLTAASVMAVATLAPTLAAAAAPVVAAATPSATVNAASSWWSRIKLQEVLRWFLIATAIVGIFLFLLWLLRKLFGGPK